MTSSEMSVTESHPFFSIHSHDHVALHVPKLAFGDGRIAGTAMKLENILAQYKR